VALIWLADQSMTAKVAPISTPNASALFIDEVMAGSELKLKFNNPAVDSRTPDIIVQPQYGTIYTNLVEEERGARRLQLRRPNVGLIVSGAVFRSARSRLRWLLRKLRRDSAGSRIDPKGYGRARRENRRAARMKP